MNELIITTPEQLREIIENAVRSTMQTVPQIPSHAEPEKNLYSISDLADFIGCSVATAMRLKKSGRIRFYQTGRKVIFKTVEVLEDLKKNTDKNNKKQL